VPALVAQARAEHLPLSFAQERLWFLDQLQPGGSEYNMLLVGRLSGQLDVGALSQAVSAVITRHDVLRTRFVTIGGAAEQVIDAPYGVRLEAEDLSGLAEERWPAVEAVAAEEAGRAYDLARGPLVRLRVLRLEAQEHVVVVGMHHIISDGWSMRIFMREVRTLYAAIAGGEPSSLPELPVQYSDYARWQREWLSGEVLGRQLGYWQQRLLGASGLELPTDCPRRAVLSFKGASVSLDIAGPLAAALGELARAEGATLFMVLLAAFQVVLSRWSGQDDIVVGTPIAGRTHRETEGLIGFFVNTLVLRTDVSGDPSLREVLRRTKETALGAYAHQDVPFEKLVEVLQPVRDLSRHPLFQVLINSQDVSAATASSPLNATGAGQIQGQMVSLGTGRSKFDLTLYLHRLDAGLRVDLVYNTDLFEARTAGRLLEHYRLTLDGLVADPECRLSALRLLSEEERGQLSAWNATTVAAAEEGCLHELIAAQAARTPWASAVAYEEERLSYGELDRRANQLGHHLRRLGVGPDVVVGLLVERSVRTVVGLLGILKAGGAYLPLDPDYPRERLAYMLSDARAVAVVSEGTLANGLAEHGVAVVRLDADAAALAAEPDRAPACPVVAGNLAYVIYTSGSTGRPKGVMVEHRQVLNYVLGIRCALPFAGLRNFAMVQSFTVGSAITVLYPALLSGGCLHVIERERALDAAACERYFTENAIDCLKIAPSHLAALVTASASPGDLLPALLVVAGEASPTRRMGMLSALKPTCRAFNHYGTTETTIGVLTCPITSDVRADLSSVPLGRPLANSRIHILDRELNQVPPGVVGEIYVAGDSLTRGYLGNPGLTAAQFIPDPFSDRPGARLYATNDLGRWLAEGHVQFLGRRDHQVKVRGFRVELGEIEAALLLHPQVRQAVVARRVGAGGEPRLVAYVVPANGQDLTAAALDRHLKERLPDYMLPSAIVPLAALPRSPHGKVDRLALPEPEADILDNQVRYLAPRNPTEQTIADIWSELLQRDRIGINDNFFDLGGHSLLATRIIARLRDAFAVELPLRAFFESPTIAALAKLVVPDGWEEQILIIDNAADRSDYVR
jgi:amino acid adenylation domain-containing protein